MKAIEKIEYGPLPGNIGLGVLAFQITASGEKLDSRQIADLVTLLESEKVPKQQKTVSISGFDEHSGETEMYTLCQTLKDYKYRIRVVSDGTMYHTWYKLADHLVVFVNDRLAWVKFNAHQIIYAPEKTLTEPSLPGLQPGNWLFLDTQGLSEENIREFLQNAKHTWALYLETESSVFTRDIFSGDVGLSKE